jgi:uncharacterized ion transporter superfamily protein YfcC
MFSGCAPRLAIFATLLFFGIGYVFLYVRRLPKLDHVPLAAHLTARHFCVLVSLILGAVALVFGTSVWSWETPQLTSAFIALGLLIAVVGGMRPGVAADAFLEGVKTMILPCLLIGIAGAISIILQSSQIIDTIIYGLSAPIEGLGRGAVAVGLMVVEMVFGVLIPSASAKAAVSIPILAPIAHLSGASGQIAVSALLLGSGMTNMVTPNPLLLAFLAAAKVGYADWVRFVLPLFAAFTAISLLGMYLMTVAAV